MMHQQQMEVKVMVVIELHIARLLIIPIEYIKLYYLVDNSSVNSMILLVIHKLAGIRNHAVVGYRSILVLFRIRLVAPFMYHDDSERKTNRTETQT